MASSHVAHLWANKKSRNWQSESMSSNGTTLYSYHTAIACWFNETTAVLNEYLHSNATSKHVRSVYASMLPNDEKLINVYLPTNRGFTFPKSENKKDWIELLTYYSGYYINSATKADDKRKAIQIFDTNKEAFINLGLGTEEDFINTLPENTYKLYLNNKEYVEKLKARNKYDEVLEANFVEMAEKIRAENESYVETITLRDVFVRNIKSYYKKITIRVPDSTGKKRNKTLTLSTRYSVLLPNGDTTVFIPPLSRYPVMLKVVGDYIKTSHGAEVKESHAIAMYKRLKNKENIISAHVGYFTVQSVSSESIKVGCHTIPMEEIEMLAESRGWLNN